MNDSLPALQEIEAVIRRLGVSGSYLGLPHLVRTVALALEDPDAVRSVIKRIYGPVSQEHGVSVSVLEHRIRTLRDHIWDHGNRELLEEMAGYRLSYPPTSSELIDYIAHYMKQRR